MLALLVDLRAHFACVFGIHVEDERVLFALSPDLFSREVEDDVAVVKDVDELVAVCVGCGDVVSGREDAVDDAEVGAEADERHGAHVLVGREGRSLDAQFLEERELEGPTEAGNAGVVRPQDGERWKELEPSEVLDSGVVGHVDFRDRGSESHRGHRGELAVGPCDADRFGLLQGVVVLAGVVTHAMFELK